MYFNLRWNRQIIDSEKVLIAQKENVSTLIDTPMATSTYVCYLHVSYNSSYQLKDSSIVPDLHFRLSFFPKIRRILYGIDDNLKFPRTN